MWPVSNYVTFNKDKDMYAIKKNPINLPRSRVIETLVEEATYARASARLLYSQG